MDLWKDSMYQTGNYKVDEDCVRMSKFVEKNFKLNCKFEDRKAFYEAEKEEDLLYYKKVLCPQKNVIEVF